MNGRDCMRMMVRQSKMGLKRNIRSYRTTTDQKDRVERDGLDLTHSFPLSSLISHFGFSILDIISHNLLHI